MGTGKPAKRSRLRVWLAGVVLANLIGAGVLAGLNAVGWLDADGGAVPNRGAADFVVELPEGWVENLRWGQRLVEQVDPDLVDALVYFAGLADEAGGYDPTLSVLREPLPSDAGLADVVEAKVEALRTEAPRSHVARSDEHIDGLPAVRVVVTDPPDLVSGGSFVTAQLLVVRGDEVWALQCERRTSGSGQHKEDAWEACAQAVERFRFPEGQSPGQRRSE